MTTKTKPNRRSTRPITILVDDKMRFCFDFAAQRAGKTLKAFIEQAVLDATKDSGWEAFWHDSTGMRELLRLRFGQFKRSAEDDTMRAFIAEHDDIFMRDSMPRVHVLDALWPDIKVYVDTWKRTRGTPDADKAAKQMRAVVAKLPKSVQ